MKDNKYIAATGWDRKIALFIDNQELQRIYPVAVWPRGSGLENGLHQDDIMSMVFCPPNMVATSSYDGEIVLCNFVSGHVIHRMSPPAYIHKTMYKSLDKCKLFHFIPGQSSLFHGKLNAQSCMYCSTLPTRTRNTLPSSSPHLLRRRWPNPLLEHPRRLPHVANGRHQRPT